MSKKLKLKDIEAYRPQTIPPNTPLTLLEKARLNGHNYADEWETVYDDMQQDGELVTLHAKLKTAYQQGYLDGFKFRLTGDDKA